MADVIGPAKIELWDLRQELWIEMYLVLDPAGPTAHLFVTEEQAAAAREGRPGAEKAAIIAQQPRITPDESDTGFQLLFPPEQLYQCHMDGPVRAALIARCHYTQESDLARLQAEFTRRLGNPSEPERYWISDSGKKLGEGGYSNVYPCYDSTGKERIACKVFKTSYDPNQKREIVLQAALDHPSIVGVRDIVYLPPPTGSTLGGTIYIMMENMGGGELFKLVAKEKGMSEPRAAAYFQQIMLGVAYCHGRGVCHRDLKLENVLLDDTNTVAKVADFGFAKDITNSPAASIVGTGRYVAPEQLTGESYDGSKADMWACGVILFILRECTYPFKLTGTGGVGEPGMHVATEDHRILKERLEAAEYQLKKRSSPAYQDLLGRMLNPDPAARLSAQEVLMHPWTRGEGTERAVSEAEMAQMLEQMSTAAIASPQGENPEVWLVKLHEMPDAAAGGGGGDGAGGGGGGAMTDAPPIGGGDMNMDGDEDEDEDEF